MRAANRIFNWAFDGADSGATAPRGRRVATRAAAMMLVGGVAMGGTLGMLGGCGGASKGEQAQVRGGDRAADLARAQRLQQQAYSAQKDEDYERAIELYGQALQIDSSLGAAWHNAAICFLEEKRYLEARDSFLRAAELLATDPRPYENLGVLYLERLGHARQAYDAYGRALERDPYSLAGLRGSASAIRLLRLVSTDAQGRLQRGLEVETDTKWREIMTTERIRVEAGLRKEAGN